LSHEIVAGWKKRSSDVFDAIRAACRRVAETAQHVHVEVDRIPRYASSLPIARLRRPQLDCVHHFVGGQEDTVAYFVCLDAINFGSGYFPLLRKRPGMSGYLTIASSLTDRFRRDGPLSPDDLAHIPAQDCARLFGQDEGAAGPIGELMELFASAWNDLGADLITRFGGRFDGLLQVAGHSAARLLDLLSAQPFFRDVACYRGASVPFYKRAQILASDLALAFEGAGPGRFDDLDRLTIFADNLVPHVLRVDGILRYEGTLLARIERGETIPSGSDGEIEIRACAVDAVERIVARLHETDPSITSRDVDNLLWERGQRPEIKRLPRHRTRCVFY